MSIKINNLSHIYNKKTDIEVSAINNINLELQEKCFIAIVGETGSGKTTLLQHLNGLLFPQTGEVIIDNNKLNQKKRNNNKSLLNIRKNVGYLFQFSENQLFENTVLDDVMFALSNFNYKKENAKSLALEALKKVNLNESLYSKSPFDLSGGEKRRAATAGIICYKPKYLILDEPTSGLDKKGRDDLIKLLNDLYNEGTSIIMVTHDMDTILKCCKEVILMSKGNIISYSKTHEFFKNEYLEQYGIKRPKILDFIIKNNINVDINNVYDIDTFIKEYKKIYAK